MEEVWKPIERLHNKYEVSNLGNIRNSKTKKLKAVVWDGYYLKFGYGYSYEGKIIQGYYRIHKAVAETFIANPENKPTVNHIDGNHRNNCITNLEWATAKEQSLHASNVLKIHCGENNYNAKHTNEEVREMRRLYEEEHIAIQKLCELFNDSYKNIRRIIKYERWKNI